MQNRWVVHVLKLSPRLVGLVPYEVIGPEVRRIAEWVAEIHRDQQAVPISTRAVRHFLPT
jgi:hypothetical protein